MGIRGARLQRRIAIVAVLMGLWAAVIGVRLYSLQVVQSAEYRQRASDQRERVIEISPRRGSIYDRNGNELAVSIEVDSLYADPSHVEDPRAAAEFLSGVLNEPATDLESRLDSEGAFSWIRRKLSKPEADRIRAARIPGLYFQKEFERYYPNRELASHVLGFVMRDGEGGSGLEYRYDDLIGGSGGREVVLRDARNRSFQTLEQQPTEGAHLTTTIDQNIQYIVEREVARTIAATRARAMSVVVMDPHGGEVLAMASFPQFNPNEYGRYPQESWRNRAVAQVYEPGSTFKIVTAGAALEQGLTTLEELIDCQMGHIYISGHRINDHKPFGTLSVREILQYSSDVGIIKLGMRLGDPLLADYITRMGFGRKTGIDLPGEERGLFKPAAEWSNVSVGAISMGQEIGATPLQVVNLLSMVANGGTLYRPYVVQRAEDLRTGRTTETRPEGRRVLSEPTVRELHDALRSVVTGGTGVNAAMAAYTAAGKTGTAQKIDPATGAYSPTAFVASFAGYAPATRPEVAVVVTIDEPVGPHGGGEVAAPAFKRIVEETLRYRSVPPDIPRLLPDPAGGREAAAPETAPGARPEPRTPPAEDDGSWRILDAVFEAEAGPVDNASPSAGAGVPVPDFRGRGVRQAVEVCRRLGLDCRYQGSGRAIGQSHVPGGIVPMGARVEIRFSAGHDGAADAFRAPTAAGDR